MNTEPLPKLIPLAVLFFCVAVPGNAQAAGSRQAFALISEARAESLSLAPASPASRYVLVQASIALAKAPKVLARVHVEGTLPHQGIYDQSSEALEDLGRVFYLALAWRMGWNAQDQGALNKALQFRNAAFSRLQAWLDTYRPSLNPIDESRFDTFILAWDLLKAAAPAALEAKMNTFLRALAIGYLAERSQTPSGTWTNNWQSQRIKLATLAAFALGDEALIARARAAYLRQLSDNIQRDGATIDFAERDALYYAVYDLEPLGMSALAAAAHGQNWFGLKGSTGTSLPLALQWIMPFATGNAFHLEFEHSTVDFDAKRRAARLPGFLGYWVPTEARLLFWTAGRFAPGYAQIASHLGGDQAWMSVVFPIALSAPPTQASPSSGTTTASTGQGTSPSGQGGGQAASQSNSAGGTVTMSKAQLQSLLNSLRTGTAGDSAASPTLPINQSLQKGSSGTTLSSLLNALGSGASLFSGLESDADSGSGNDSDADGLPETSLPIQ